MQTVILLCRLLLGIIFFGAGLNGYLVIFGQPPVFPTSPQAMEFLQGYLLVMVKTVEVICGLGLLLNLFAPLSLVVLAPVSVNILTFHLFVDPSLLPLGIIVFALNGFLIWAYRKHGQRLLQVKAVPR
ncbi:DoxX family membrane protein [Brevibacillus borstelensis]|uniref:DoxX family membrane protein n=1 Tax=Brevibacillus borstelensis TaxID=45462 RepID=UPI0030C593DB